MPYSIRTKDGIVLNNIPDDVPRDSEILRQRVAEARAQREASNGAQQGANQQAPGTIPRQPAAPAAPVEGQPAPPGQPPGQPPGPLQEALQGIKNVGLEAAAGVNRGVLGLADVPATVANAALELGGSDTRAPLLSQTKLGQQATQGGYVENPILRQIIGQGSEIAAPVPPVVAALRSVKGGIKTAGDSVRRVLPKKMEAKMLEAAPSREALEDFAEGLYTTVNTSNVAMPYDRVEKLRRQFLKDSKSIKTFLGDSPSGTTSIARESQEVGRTLDLLNKKVDAGASLDLQDLHNVRKMVINSIPESSNEEVGSLVNMLDTIDDMMHPANVTKNFVGESAEQLRNIKPTLDMARSAYGRAARSAIVERAFHRAEQAHISSGVDFNKALRGELGKVLKKADPGRGVRPSGEGRFFTPSEVSELKAVVEGTTPQRVAEFLGGTNFTPNRVFSSYLRMGILPTAGGAVGTMVGGPGVGTGVGGALGVGATRFLNSLSTQKRSQAAINLAARIRAGDAGPDVVRGYLSKVPKGKRSMDDLTDLLSTQKNLSPDAYPDDAFVQEAVTRAIKRVRGYGILGAGSAATANRNLNIDELPPEEDVGRTMVPRGLP